MSFDKAGAKTVACHISAHHFIADGVATHVKRLKELAAVNTLFVDAFCSSESGCKTPVPSACFAWPEAVSQKTGVRLKSLVTYDAAKHNVYQQLHEHSDSADMPVYVRILEYANQHLSGLESFCEVNHAGEKLGTMCWNNPSYQQTWAGICAHIVSTQAVAGIHFGAERSGPMSNVLTFGRTKESCCFCKHCVQTANDKGINVERARQGFAALADLDSNAREHESRFLQMFRLLVLFPEVLAWQRLWVESRNNGFTAIRTAVKVANPDANVGFHIFQFSCSLDFFAAATCDYAEWASFSDHIKPCLYQDAASYRGKDLVDMFLSQHYFKGQDEKVVYDFLQQAMGDVSSKETNYHNVRERGMGGEYTASHTRAAAEAVNTARNTVKNTACQLWPAIGINVEQKLCGAQADKHIGESVVAAFENGADGIVLCREYQEMTDSALRAVGTAIHKIHETSEV
ncbi:MAG: hypothetical protein HRU15_00025 [Planctomycetes bacterium]|nr:hypothetical protein [Planctomycetota bacterium]